MKQKLAKNLVAVGIGMGIACPAMAGLVVDWSNPGITSLGTNDIDISWGATTAVGNVQNFTAGDMSSAVDPLYLGQPLNIIGQTEGSLGTVPFETAFVENDSTTRQGFLIYGVQGAGDTRKTTGLFYIDAADFINGGVSPGDTVSSMTLNLEQQRGDISKNRFAVKSGGAWYVSDFNADGAGGTISGVYTYTAGASGDWASFTPSTGTSASLMTADGLTFNIDGSTLNNIEALGFFFEGELSGTARARFRLEDFTVETVAVPEPAALGLMLVGAGALLFRRRYTI